MTMNNTGMGRTKKGIVLGSICTVITIVLLFLFSNNMPAGITVAVITVSLSISFLRIVYKFKVVIS